MSERTSDEIRRDIERKRQDMDRTVDELERRLTPAQMLDHALWMLRGSDTGAERARAVAGGVARFAKEHPIPVALMSAGAAWLLAESRRDEPVGAGTYAPAEGRVGPYMGDALDSGPLRDAPSRYGGVASNGTGPDGGPSLTDRTRESVGDARAAVSERVHSVGDRVHDVAESARERLDAAREGVRERVQDVRESARERAHAAAESARWTADVARERAAELSWRARAEAGLRARQARERYDTTLEENPLVLGALAFGVGLAAGVAAPTTRVESGLMGAKSDALKDEARVLGQDAVRAARAAAAQAASVARREALPENIVEEARERVKRVASSALDSARETARSEGLTVDTLKERAKRVAADAVSAAKETARHEGLTAEALKERAVEAGERARDA